MLSPLQEKQLGIFVDMNKLLITLATLSLGGIGAFVFNRYKAQELPWYQVWRAVGASSFCGLSNRGGFQHVSLGSPVPPEELIIGVPEVEKFPVARFLESLASVFQGSTGEGHLQVTSVPDRASIEIDGKDRGDTCKKFVTSAGRHSVRVRSNDGKLDCKKDDLIIPPGKTERFSCPEKTECPNNSVPSPRSLAGVAGSDRFSAGRLLIRCSAGDTMPTLVNRHPCCEFGTNAFYRTDTAVD